MISRTGPQWQAGVSERSRITRVERLAVDVAVAVAGAGTADEGKKLLDSDKSYAFGVRALRVRRGSLRKKRAERRSLRTPIGRAATTPLPWTV